MANGDHITRLDWIARLQCFDAINAHLAAGSQFDRKAAVLDDARVP